MTEEDAEKKDLTVDSTLLELTEKKLEKAQAEEESYANLMHNNAEMGELAARFCYAAAGLPTPIIEEILELFETISDNHRSGKYQDRRPC
ncbi:hypothetical protein GCM10017044_16850 [Kordiimonas sediminis]|uniref:Uncharacterized protein n=1 Tax=Kordiimonas sediminis TaxID=1735581 RepID=A0A919E801_9PROT|nr:hypothetical protein [Kordiimonas sediminis]GHF23068.1 hypothetical protein GCM10017044_16850 [Kordiimonas sediminis]